MFFIYYFFFSFSELSHRHLSQIQSYCQQSAVPPDDTARIAPAYQHARDVYAFACLVDDLLVSNPAFGGGSNDILPQIWKNKPIQPDVRGIATCVGHY